MGDLMPPMHGQIHHVAWLEMDVVPDALLAEGSIDVITFVGMRVETTIGSEGARGEPGVPSQGRCRPQCASSSVCSHR